MRIFAITLVVVGLVTVGAHGQERRPSPRGWAATQVAGKWVDGAFAEGHWVEVEYGRPILRGRTNTWASGDQYGQGLLLDAPVWRVGADESTQLMTSIDLQFGEFRLPAGRYTVFAETAPQEWTLIFSTYRPAETYREAGLLRAAGFRRPPALWGAYGYTPDRDVLRAPMRVSTVDRSADELTIAFVNMTQEGGELMIWWDDQMAMTPFRVAP
jgi:hypothetical protein